MALIPIGAILYVSAVQLGASSLKDLALAQFVGMAAGVFSSVFIAPRVLVHLKSSEADVVLADKRAQGPGQARRRPLRVGAGVHRGHADPRRARSVDEAEGDLDDGARVPAGHADRHRDRRREAAGRGRIAPQARGPVQESPASGRQQPTRQSKSKRDKK